MTKSKPSASFIVVLSIFVMHLVNGAQVLIATCFIRAVRTVILPLNKMLTSL